jgi:metal-responsive CopG/Arc/MetJ family transcriptional regulator
MRIHVVLPDELVADVDQMVGKRQRSRFVEEAIREKLKRESRRAALHKAAGVLSPEDNPEWTTSDETYKWVRKSRQADDERLKRLSGDKVHS